MMSATIHSEPSIIQKIAKLSRTKCRSNPLSCGLSAQTIVDETTGAGVDIV